MAWLKRITLVAGIIIALELIAWVGIALLGKDAFRELLDFYDPRPDVGTVTSETREDGSVQKCSTFNGELFCIADGAPASRARDIGRERPSDGAQDETNQSTDNPRNDTLIEKCTTLEGELFCISERARSGDWTGDGASAAKNRPGGGLSQDTGVQLTEKCADFEGETICIKERI